MSAVELSPSKQNVGQPLSLSIKPLPRISIFQSERSVNVNLDNEFQEVSTPLLPKGFGKKKKGNLQERRNFLGVQEQENLEVAQTGAAFTEDCSPVSKPLSILADRNNQQKDLISPLGSSSCGEESPLERKLRRSRLSPTRSPLRQQEPKCTDTEACYQRIEEFLDSEKLFVLQPEDGRRRSFNHLTVMTTKIKSSDAGSEYNSPSLISPSIHTSSLLQKRSSSRENSVDAPNKQKKTLTKSPFYLLSNKDKQVTQMKKLDSEENQVNDLTRSPSSKKSSPIKRPFALSVLNTKLKQLTFKSDDTEASSATSIKEDEMKSPEPNFLAKRLGLCE